jgi:hypothetical protein
MLKGIILYNLIYLFLILIAKFDNIKDDSWIPTNLEGNKYYYYLCTCSHISETQTLTDKLSLTEMIQRDTELWSLAKDYDLENSRKVMERNKQYDLDHGTVPYYPKWDHTSQDSSSDSDMNVYSTRDYMII